jgi:hypothetical protein
MRIFLCIGLLAVPGVLHAQKAITIPFPPGGAIGAKAIAEAAPDQFREVVAASIEASRRIANENRLKFD